MESQAHGDGVPILERVRRALATIDGFVRRLGRVARPPVALAPSAHSNSYATARLGASVAGAAIPTAVQVHYTSPTSPRTFHPLRNDARTSGSADQSPRAAAMLSAALRMARPTVLSRSAIGARALARLGIDLTLTHASAALRQHESMLGDRPSRAARLAVHQAAAAPSRIDNALVAPTGAGSAGRVARVLSRAEDSSAKLRAAARALPALPTSAARNPTGRDADGVLRQASGRSGLANRPAFAAAPNTVALRSAHRAAMHAPEFTSPQRNSRSRPAAGASAPITINSSPTVVINSGGEGRDVEQQVVSALRQHRAEMFDELRRESAMRRRSEF